MPRALEDGTWVYNSIQEAIWWAKGCGFEIRDTQIGTVARRPDVFGEFKLVPQKNNTYIWHRN